MSDVKKFRKKPVVIDAMQFKGGAAAATPIINWVLENGGTARWMEEYEVPEVDTEYSGDSLIIPERITISTLEGDMAANVGWWVIRGVKGEFYPCDPDIFEKTYTEVL